MFLVLLFLLLAAPPPGGGEAAPDGGGPPERPPVAAERPLTGEGLIRKGRYAEAEKAFEGERGDPARAKDALAGLVRVRLLTGRAQDALALIGDEDRRDEEPSLRTLRADVLLARGRAAQAREILSGLAEKGEARAEFLLAETLEREGDFAGAARLREALLLRKPAAAAEAYALHALQGQAARGLFRFQEAHDFLVEALKGDPEDPDLHVLLGGLLLEKGDIGRAADSFGDALLLAPGHPGALSGVGLATLQGGLPVYPDGKTKFQVAERRFHEALEANPSFGPALDGLARLHLALEEEEDALRFARRGAEGNPGRISSLALAGAAGLLKDDRRGFQGFRALALSETRRPAEFHRIVGEILSDRYRFAEAADHLRLALDLREGDPSIQADLGMALLRLGDEEAGRALLDRSFALDKHRIEVAETLNLLDRMAGKEFVTLETPNFRIRMGAGEAAVFGELVKARAEEALDRLSRRFGRRPPAPILLEIFPTHDDFSVRTVGVVSIEALGACFGRLVTMPSPSERPFRWTEVLRHELSHAVTLDLSRGRIPRWLTEGIARACEEESPPSADVFFANGIRQGLFHGIRGMNAGFHRPRNPWEVAFAYEEAAAFVAFLEKERGAKAVVELVRSIGEGRTLEDALREAAGQDLPTLEEKFRKHAEAAAAKMVVPLLAGDDWVERLKKQAQARPDDAAAHAALAEALLERGDGVGADQAARRAAGIDPGMAPAVRVLARLAWQRGLPDEAERLYREAAEEEGPGAFFTEVGLAALALEAWGDYGRARARLERALRLQPGWVHPGPGRLDPPHEMLLSILREQKDAEGEAELLSAWASADRENGEARMRLARSLAARGENGRARKALEEVLEIDPFDAEARALLSRLLRLDGDAKRADEEAEIVERIRRKRD